MGLLEKSKEREESIKKKVREDVLSVVKLSSVETSSAKPSAAESPKPESSKPESSAEAGMSYGMSSTDKKEKADNARTQTASQSVAGTPVAASLNIYETEVDALYNLVKESKRILLKEAAIKIGITTNKAEKWADILAKHDLIKIHYPAFGLTELRSADYEDEKKKPLLSRFSKKQIVIALIALVVIAATIFILKKWVLK